MLGAWAILSLAPLAMTCADEEPAPQADDSTETRDYWIGVMGAEVDALVRTHLLLDGGVVVEQAVPDSPAAKAGLKENDIVLEFNGKPVSTVAGLAEAVNQAGDREVAVTLLREGKQQTERIKPELRPAGSVTVLPPPGEIRKVEDWIKRFEEGRWQGEPFRMWRFGPGVVVTNKPGETRIRAFRAALRRLPEGIEITISRSQDKPVDIVIRRGEETWNVTPENLQELPAEILDAVNAMVSAYPGVPLELEADVEWFTRPTPRPAEKPRTGGPPKGPRGEAKPVLPESLQEELGELQEQLQVQQKKLQEQLDKLRERLEKARQEWMGEGPSE